MKRELAVFSQSSFLFHINKISAYSKAENEDLDKTEDVWKDKPTAYGFSFRNIGFYDNF